MCVPLTRLILQIVKLILFRLQSIVEAHFIYLLFICCMFRLQFTSLIHVVNLCMLTRIFINYPAHFI